MVLRPGTEDAVSVVGISLPSHWHTTIPSNMVLTWQEATESGINLVSLGCASALPIKKLKHIFIKKKFWDQK